MEDYAWIIIIIGISVAWGIISWIIEIVQNSKKYLNLKPKLDNLEESIKNHDLKIQKGEEDLQSKRKQLFDGYSQKVKEHESKVEGDREDWKLKVKNWDKKIADDKGEIRKIAKQKSMGFPWLAEAYADYFALKDGELEEYLKKKKHPAYTAAQNVRIIKNEKMALVKENKIFSYKIKYLEKLFPWISELITENEDEEIPVMIFGDTEDNKEDRVKDLLTQEEYRKLPSVVRNQKALDRYLQNTHRSRWQIGRDYEMYVGHIYEKKGYSIEYTGIIDGYDDLGRDIIATKSNEVCIIQCKRWAQWKVMREKHIFQLFGTTMEYWIKNFKNKNEPKNFEEFAKFLNEDKLRPIFFTSTTLSDRAKQMAEALSIEIIENEPIGDFPRIKCNVSGRNSEKIYHLPFDQQYDRTIIEPHKGEFYAFTVKEAEDAGFRRAFRYSGLGKK